MKGRKPKPTALRLLNGNPGRRPLNDSEAQIQAAIPKPPKIIQGTARKEWRRISVLLYEAGLLTKVDSSALAAYCQSYARWCEAEDEIRRSGTVIKSGRGEPIVSPFLKVANVAWQQWTRMLVEFGMTPSSRSRVKVTKPAQKSKFQELLDEQSG